MSGILNSMDDYGGGGTGSGDYGGPGKVGYEGPLKRHFYLVVRSNQREHALDASDIQSFYRSGVNSGRDYIFILVDMSNDPRLANDLIKLSGGPEFLDKLRDSVPAFLISVNPIPQLDSTLPIQMYPIRNYSKDMTIIYNEMGIKSLESRQAFVGFLRKLNSYMHLKPSVFGIGANLNEIIGDLIKRLEEKSP